MSRTRRERRWKGRGVRALRVAGRAAALGLTFVVAVVLGALLHLDTPAARHLVAGAVNDLLADTFRGRIAVTQVDHLRLGAIDGVHATLTGPDGVPLARVDGARGRVALRPLVASLLAGRDLRVDVLELAIDEAEVTLAEGTDGALTVAEAFQPARFGPPPPPAAGDAGIALSMPRITLAHAVVHGRTSAAPRMEAELRELEGLFVQSPAALTADVHHLRVTTRGMPREADLALILRGRVVVPASGPVDAALAANGTVGGIDVAVHGAWDHGQLDAAADVPRVAPAALARLLGSAKVHETTSVHAEAHGTWPVIEPQVRVTIGQGVLDARGWVRLPSDRGPPAGGRLTLPGRDLDAPAVAPTAPSSRLAPRFALAARAAGEGLALEGAGSASAQGVDAELRFVTSLRAGGEGDLAFDARVRARDLAQVPLLGGAVRGRALLDASGRIELPTRRLQGQLDGEVDDVAAGGVVARHAALSGVVSGRLDAPSAILRVEGEQLGAAGCVFPAFGVTVAGERREIRLAARFEGVGRPLEAEGRLRPGAVEAKLRTDGLDLAKLSPANTSLKGQVALDVDLRATTRETRGHVSATLAKLAYGSFVRGLDATVAASFDGRDASLAVDGRDAAGDVVAVRSVDGRLGGGGLDPRAWRGTTGHLRVDTTLDLARANAIAGDASPFASLQGSLSGALDVTRDDPRQRPVVALDVVTRHLAFVTRPRTVAAGRARVVVGTPVKATPVDAHVAGRIDGESGASHVAAILADAAGTLLQADVATTLPMPDLFAGRAADALRATPIELHAEVPLRPLETLPPLGGPWPMTGRVGLTLDAHGSAQAPDVRAIFRARELVDASDDTPTPVAVDATLTYDGDEAKGALVVDRREGRALDARAGVKIRSGDPGAWDADADVRFTRFPIGAVTAVLTDANVDGDITGTVALRGLHRAADLGVDLDMAGGSVDRVPFGRVKVASTVRDGAWGARLRVDQRAGFLDARANGGMRWGAELAPSLDAARALEVALRASGFRFGAVAPLLRGAVSELDGVLNADARLRMKPGLKDGAMDGALLVDRGVVEAPAIGQELRDLRARIFMKPWGVWNVQELSASGTSGRFTAEAVAKLDGLRLREAEAHLRIPQKDRFLLTTQGVELGTAWGQVDARAALAPDHRTLNVDVTVPTLHVELPHSIGHAVQSTTLDPSIEAGAIGRDGKVTLLAVDGTTPLLVPEPPDAKKEPPMKLHVVTHLGPEVEVRRGALLRVFASGGPTIDLGPETSLSGKLSVPRGYVELQGKRFQVERGVIDFTGQPKDDPVVLATAAYTAPDGTKVYADFVGPVKSGKLALRSEPALSQNEILALLLYGSADGTFGQSASSGGQTSGANQGAGLAGGVVTEGLNKVLSGVAGVELQTKVDTQQSGNARPEVEVGLSRDVSATVIYNLGVPPPGQNPDNTLLEVDWRFHTRFSTQATLGDKGTSILDLTWRYRY